ncbi:MAG: hypothetical protein KJ624_04635 [Chloroflexi bacterium]|nr:hypothetical protein [Chloroflexota bacterium]
MESLKLGILEDREDPFIRDLIAHMGVEAEFLSFGEEVVVPSPPYRVVIDRASYSNPYLKEMMKGLALDGCYVINNPFTASATNKLMDIRLSAHLGIPVPRTLVLPDLKVKEQFPAMVREPVWERVAREVGFPCVLKPFDGYGWTDVFVVNSPEEMRDLYGSQNHIFIAQQLISYSVYYRVFCIDQKEVLFMQWVPRPLGAGEYLLTDPTPIEGLRDKLTLLTTELNRALDLDINVLEWCLDREGQPWLIDAFNEVPEIKRENLPEEYYRWILEKLAACVQDKLQHPEKRNRAALGLPLNP